MKEYCLVEKTDLEDSQAAINRLAFHGWRLVSIAYASGPMWNRYIAAMERDKDLAALQEKESHGQAV